MRTIIEMNIKILHTIMGSHHSLFVIKKFEGEGLSDPQNSYALPLVTHWPFINSSFLLTLEFKVKANLIYEFVA